jgi:endonuclease/exonuclease/phosphatase family metal-dependent hydrolase
MRFAVTLAAVMTTLSCGAPPDEEVQVSGAELGEPSGRCAGVAVREHRSLSVMTINLRRQEDDWERRLPLVAGEIARLGPVVIGLQEGMIIFGQAQRIADRVVELGGPRYHVVQAHKPGIIGWLTGEGIAVMSRWPIAASETIDLGSMRVAQLARIGLPSGAAFDMLNTHLENGQSPDKDAVRLAEARELARFADEHDACNVELLTGDFNTVPTAPATTQLVMQGFEDSYADVHGAADDGDTFPVALADGAFAQHATMRMDFVFHRRAGARSARAVDSTVCFTGADPGGFHASDHFGVMTTFEGDF